MQRICNLAGEDQTANLRFVDLVLFVRFPKCFSESFLIIF